MDEAQELKKYLPISFKTPGEQEYIAFLWEAVEKNYQPGYTSLPSSPITCSP